MTDELHESGSELDEESVGATYTALMDQVEAVVQMLETAETALHRLQRPIELLMLDQLGDVPFLQTSPFRHQTFSLKRAPTVRVPFHTLCAELRRTCLPLVQDGVIQTSSFLQEQLHVSTKTTSFPQLLGSLTFGVA